MRDGLRPLSTVPSVMSQLPAWYSALCWNSQQSTAPLCQMPQPWFWSAGINLYALFVCLFSVVFTQASISDKIFRSVLVSGIKWPFNLVPKVSLGIFCIFIFLPSSRLSVVMLLEGTWFLGGKCLFSVGRILLFLGFLIASPYFVFQLLQNDLLLNHSLSECLWLKDPGFSV